MTVGCGLSSQRVQEPRMDRWRLYVVAYMTWLIVFTVVEGTGRQVCRMPTAKWIAAGADARDRTARTWFRDRARECLNATRWYSYSTAGLLGAGLVAPFAAVWAMRRRGLQFNRTRPFSS